MSKLSHDTLFVPDYVLVKFNMFNGDESQRHAVDELFKDYPYPYEILHPDLLSERIAAGQVRYVFDYVKSSSDNYIRIYELSKGKIYQEYKSISYNLSSKDLKKIVK